MLGQNSSNANPVLFIFVYIYVFYSVIVFFLLNRKYCEFGHNEGFLGMGKEKGYAQPRKEMRKL